MKMIGLALLCICALGVTPGRAQAPDYEAPDGLCDSVAQAPVYALGELQGRRAAAPDVVGLMFASADTDANDRLDFAEALSGGLPNTVAQAFTAIDRDGDGALTAEELSAWFDAGVSAYVSGLLRHYDADADGRLQGAEIPEILRALLPGGAADPTPLSQTELTQLVLSSLGRALDQHAQSP